jgi:hypothetical protein
MYHTNDYSTDKKNRNIFLTNVFYNSRQQVDFFFFTFMALLTLASPCTCPGLTAIHRCEMTGCRRTIDPLGALPLDALPTGADGSPAASVTASPTHPQPQPQPQPQPHPQPSPLPQPQLQPQPPRANLQTVPLGRACSISWCALSDVLSYISAQDSPVRNSI